MMKHTKLRIILLLEGITKGRYPAVVNSFCPFYPCYSSVFSSFIRYCFVVDLVQANGSRGSAASCAGNSRCNRGIDPKHSAEEERASNWRASLLEGCLRHLPQKYALTIQVSFLQSLNIAHKYVVRWSAKYLHIPVVRYTYMYSHETFCYELERFGSADSVNLSLPR